MNTVINVFIHLIVLERVKKRIGMFTKKYVCVSIAVVIAVNIFTPFRLFFYN